MDEVLSAIHKSTSSTRKSVAESSGGKVAIPIVDSEMEETYLIEEMTTHVPIYHYRYDKKLEMPTYEGEDDHLGIQSELLKLTYNDPLKVMESIEWIEEGNLVMRPTQELEPNKALKGIKGMEVVVLSDYRATYNFISEELVRQLGIPIMNTSRTMIKTIRVGGIRGIGGVGLHDTPRWRERGLISKEI
ncbi:unnamed protein product [Dovyalis caffra]|uniref:Uncharacterized protein n=1 Tax=Dovyalis caffra TaxID=77055 RepID=A0AAV1RGX7_9ROSI|nr:unnamed protein product [Dovyalis caffra]